jgi:hypothetical protein
MKINHTKFSQEVAMFQQMTKIFVFIFILFIILIFSACSEDSSTDSSQSTTPGINSTDFAFSVGNEWNYNGTGYNSSGAVELKSVSTSKLRIISETNSNGLNGFKFYSSYKDYLGSTKSEGEDFFSTENDGLWTLERHSNGSMSPVKILPFGVNNSTIRSEVISKQMQFYTSGSDFYVENITMDINVLFEYLDSENTTVSAGVFNNCKKIRVIIDVSQRSDTSGVELFNGKTWSVESVWWLSTNNGLIKTETSFNSVVDSIVSNIIWDPITGEYTYIYESILEVNISSRNLNYFDIDDLMIPVSGPWYKTRMSGLTHLGKYITELRNKNF